jgi:hypothetical protein
LDFRAHLHVLKRTAKPNPVPFGRPQRMFG